jgi:hypothetical protein
MIFYNGRKIDVVKLLQSWRCKYDEKISEEDFYYTLPNKNRDETRLLNNLQTDAQETIENLFMYGDIPEDADIYEDIK